MSFAARVRARLGRRGKVLAVKLGYNPNSSSLGADVTFLILGAASISILGPILATAVRLALRRGGASAAPPAAPEAPVASGGAGGAAAP